MDCFFISLGYMSVSYTHLDVYKRQLQDILFEARLRPRHKISELSEEDIKNIFNSIKSVLLDMTEHGGRDTEKDIFGSPGRYKTKLSKNTYKNGCSICGSEITKESYLGGTVYYCPKCQI